MLLEGLVDIAISLRKLLFYILESVLTENCSNVSVLFVEYFIMHCLMRNKNNSVDFLNCKRGSVKADA